jgi:hypothetical protein
MIVSLNALSVFKFKIPAGPAFTAVVEQPVSYKLAHSGLGQEEQLYTIVY